jgi:hypothetical protein
MQYVDLALEVPDSALWVFGAMGAERELEKAEEEYVHVRRKMKQRRAGGSEKDLPPLILL